MTLAQQIDTIMREAGLAMEHYGWLCVAASRSRSTTGGGAEKFFCKSIAEAFGEQVTPSQFEAVLEKLSALNPNLLRVADGRLGMQLYQQGRQHVQLHPECDLPAVVAYAADQCGGKFYNTHAYRAMDNATIDDWLELEDMELLPNLGAALKDMMLFLLRIQMDTIHYPKVNKSAENRQIISDIMISHGIQAVFKNLLMYITCLCLEGLGFGELQRKGTGAKGAGIGSRLKWSFIKCKIDARLCAHGFNATGIVALGLHIAESPSLSECPSIAMSSTLHGSDCRNRIWKGKVLDEALRFLRLPTASECAAAVGAHRNLPPGGAADGQPCVGAGRAASMLGKATCQRNKSSVEQAHRRSMGPRSLDLERPAAQRRGSSVAAKTSPPDLQRPKAERPKPDDAPMRKAPRVAPSTPRADEAIPPDHAYPNLGPGNDDDLYEPDGEEADEAYDPSNFESDDDVAVSFFWKGMALRATAE